MGVYVEVEKYVFDRFGVGEVVMECMKCHGLVLNWFKS